MSNLIDYLPLFLRSIRELRYITGAEQQEITDIYNAAKDVLDDQFVRSATVNGIRRWEQMLAIIPKATATLDERKFTILTRINEQPPFTVRTLDEKLKNLCGDEEYEIKLDAKSYLLEVSVGLEAKSKYDDVNALLKRIVPANIIINLGLKYNQHITLAAYQHNELASYTYKQLRNEVLSHA